MRLFETLPRAAESDREHLFAVADFFCALAEQTWREGILSLEMYIDADAQSVDCQGEPSPFTGEENWLFSLLLEMVVNGVDGEIIRRTATYALSASRAAGGEKLSLMIGAEGVLQIQAGENHVVMEQGFCAMMGFPLGKAYRSHCEEARKQKDRAVQEACMKRGAPLPDDWDAAAVTVETSTGEKLSFEDISRLTDRSVQKLLRETLTAELSRALKCASGEVWNAVFRNMSPRAASMLNDEIACMGKIPLPDIQSSQRTIADTLRRHRESGDAVFTAELTITQQEIDELLSDEELPPGDDAAQEPDDRRR